MGRYNDAAIDASNAYSYLDAGSRTGDVETDRLLIVAKRACQRAMVACVRKAKEAGEAVDPGLEMYAED